MTRIEQAIHQLQQGSETICKRGNTKMTKIEHFNPLLNETFVFRPTDAPIKGTVVTTYGYKHEGQGLLRYADGKWIPDDGEPDLAFVEGVFAYGVSLPYSTNILWAWRDLDLSQSFLPKDLYRHTRGWHYQTVGNTDWEDYRWSGFDEGRDKHPNSVAYQSAMDKCCSIHSCANGRSIELCQDNEWIKRGLLWVQSTMQPVKAPENPTCFLCLNNGRGHLLEALQSKRSSLEGDIEYHREAAAKAERDLDDYTYAIEEDTKTLQQIKQEIQALGVALEETE